MNSFSRVTQYLLFLIIILIPFSIRHVFDSPLNFQTGAYSDFTSLSLYISDLLMLGFLGSFIVSRQTKTLPKIWVYALFSAIVWLILELIIQPKEFFPLQIYFSIRLIILMIFAGAVSQISVSREKISWLFAILGAIQGLIATIQFYTQKSIGLYVLGESHLSPETSGVAKIVSHGTTLIRGYGTFPHANLLAAFLVTTTALNLYLIAIYYQIPRGKFTPRGIILLTALFMNVFGLFLSFSRAGILGLLVTLFALGMFFTWNKLFSTLIKVYIPAGIAIMLSIAILYPHLTSRATVTDKATKERVFYNSIGSKLIKDKPLFGVGAGNSVLHMKQYSNIELKPWEIQPVHNYYLISAAEWGIGGIFLGFMVIYPIYALFKRKNALFHYILLSLGLSFLILLLFDHYFYILYYLANPAFIVAFNWTNNESSRFTAII
jgi:hypothetical protein